jgi:ATP-dependent Clp protease ATP-binding subunit ClpA
MFERFSEDGRQTVVQAQQEARALGHDYLGTEHLLLGLLQQPEGVAAEALTSLGVTLAGTRTQVETIVGRGERSAEGQVPFSPRAKRALELALREALSLGHNYIGAEHILLGLVRHDEGVAMRILLEHATADGVRDRVVQRLAAAPQLGAGPTSKVSWLRTPWRWRWEYRVEHDLGDEEMNALGAESWELVAALPRGEQVQLLFKRAIRPGGPSPASAAEEAG